MKKLLFLTVAMLIMAGSSFAQYKPEAKSIGTEVQFNPFDQGGKTFKLDGLKVRYFITAKDAVRLKVGLGLNKDKSSLSNDYSNPNSNYVYVSDSISRAITGDFNLSLGYERHFDVAKRLSVYVGGSLGFNRHFASSKITKTINDNGDITKRTKKARNGAFDAWGNPGYYRDRGSWSFDAAVFTGLDFYVYKGLYLGTELGLGLKTSKQGKVKYSEEITMGGKTMIQELPDNSPRVSNTTFGFYIEPTLRLGWTF